MGEIKTFNIHWNGWHNNALIISIKAVTQKEAFTKALRESLLGNIDRRLVNLPDHCFKVVEVG